MNKYKILNKKGEGTFSDVVKAQSIKNGQFVAIKKMKHTFESIEQVHALREVQALKRLSPHNHIVTLHEVVYDQSSGKLALVFELMDRNIYELIKNRGTFLEEELVKKYMYQLLKAVDHMHKNGIFHRDIKPENLLVSEGLLKLADFGSCRGIYSKQPYTEYISTRWYRAPECLLTEGYYGYKMDMWGLGCVMFEILSLYPLFPGSNEADQIERIHKICGTPPPELLAKFKTYANSHVDFNFPVHKSKPGGLASMQGMERLSREAIDLMQKLLIYDPGERITAKDSLRHPWFSDLRAQEKKAREEAKLRKAATEASAAATSPNGTLSGGAGSGSVVEAGGGGGMTSASLLGSSSPTPAVGEGGVASSGIPPLVNGLNTNSEKPSGSSTLKLMSPAVYPPQKQQQAAQQSGSTSGNSASEAFAVNFNGGLSLGMAGELDAGRSMVLPPLSVLSSNSTGPPPSHPPISGSLVNPLSPALASTTGITGAGKQSSSLLPPISLPSPGVDQRGGIEAPKGEGPENRGAKMLGGGGVTGGKKTLKSLGDSVPPPQNDPLLWNSKQDNGGRTGGASAKVAALASSYKLISDGNGAASEKFVGARGSSYKQPQQQKAPGGLAAGIVETELSSPPAPRQQHNAADRSGGGYNNQSTSSYSSSLSSSSNLLSPHKNSKVDTTVASVLQILSPKNQYLQATAKRGGNGAVKSTLQQSLSYNASSGSKMGINGLRGFLSDGTGGENNSNKKIVSGSGVAEFSFARGVGAAQRPADAPAVAAAPSYANIRYTSSSKNAQGSVAGNFSSGLGSSILGQALASNSLEKLLSLSRRGGIGAPAGSLAGNSMLRNNFGSLDVGGGVKLSVKASTSSLPNQSQPQAEKQRLSPIPASSSGGAGEVANSRSLGGGGGYNVNSSSSSSKQSVSLALAPSFRNNSNPSIRQALELLAKGGSYDTAGASGYLSNQQQKKLEVSGPKGSSLLYPSKTNSRSLGVEGGESQATLQLGYGGMRNSQLLLEGGGGGRNASKLLGGSGGGANVLSPLRLSMAGGGTYTGASMAPSLASLSSYGQGSGYARVEGTGGARRLPRIDKGPLQAYQGR